MEHWSDRAGERRYSITRTLSFRHPLALCTPSCPNLCVFLLCFFLIFSGDDFYNGFLGPSMTYTSGIWHTDNDTLEQAQINKMELIAQKIHLKAGEKHLDLGCGWGTFINFVSHTQTNLRSPLSRSFSFHLLYLESFCHGLRTVWLFGFTNLCSPLATSQVD